MTDASTCTEQTDGVVRECPFEGCEWSHESKIGGDHEADFEAEMHYEREHAGRVRIQVTLEKEQLLGSRDTSDIRERVLDEIKEEHPGWDAAYARTEVIDEADDHGRIKQ